MRFFDRWLARTFRLYGPGASSLAAGVVRREILRATFHGHANHEDLNVDDLNDAIRLAKNETA